MNATSESRRAADAESFRQTLISTSHNLAIPSAELVGAAITPDCPIPWSIRKLALHGGKQEGVELVIIDNGKLRISVIPTRGMGILDVVCGDVRLGWNSPVKDVVHPRHVNLLGRGGLGWLEGFNEWLVRCGMENNGGPGADEFIDNNGNPATMQLTLHGRVANLPAQEVDVVVQKRPPYRLSVRGRVDERTMFGPKLELETELSTEPGSSAFRVSDVVTNRGGQEQEFQMLYHCNFGRPLLEAGSTFLAAVDRVTPINEHSAKSVGRYAQFAGPKAGFVEEVYCMRPRADADGRTMAMLRNAAKDRGLSVAFSLKELPYLTLWKNTAAEADGYVTGIEPATNFPHNRRIERQAGRVPKLAPGASHRMRLDFDVLIGAEAVRQGVERIGQLQGQKAAIVDAKAEE
jgi:hypothetical protein